MEKTDNRLVTIAQIQDCFKQATQKQCKQDTVRKQVSLCQLFRFATKTDLILIIFGTIASLIMGATLPVFAFLEGQMIKTFNISAEEMVEKSKQVMFVYFGIGGAALICGWIMFACWMISGQRQAIACRKAYLNSLLRQEIGWFDIINQSQLASNFSTDCFSYQGAVGQKNSSVLMVLGMFIACFSIIFSIGWLLSLVLLISIPCIGITGYFLMYSLQRKDQKESKYYSKAGGLAQQALSSIKTVKMLNGQQFQAVQYQKCLLQVTKKTMKYSIMAGLGIGGLYGAMLSAYSLGFWFGSHCVQETNLCSTGQTYTASSVMVIFFCIQFAGFNLITLTPSLKKIAQGRQAAARIYQIIDRQPQIKNSQNPIVPLTFKGIFKFQNVSFSYPKNKNIKILDNISFQINDHSSALTGESGCGKSTIFQLIMRFYDPDVGKITLDGIDLKNLDIFWLRQNIGYVGQEPVLFANSIRQNLSFGKKDATDQQINEALKRAEAFDFVHSLDKKLETYVGSGGGQLSGGQKQRIAIARALLRNPKLLLLDEATSALDRKNQRLIQQTLDRIASERTTITIAHRVKTIMNCNKIYVLNKGTIQQSGKFKDLKKFLSLTNEQDLKNSPAQDQNQNPEQRQTEINQSHAIIDLNDPNSTENKKSEEQAQEEQKQKLLEKYKDSIFRRMLSYVKGSSIPIFIVATFMSMINGVILPIFAIFLGKILSLLINYNSNKQQSRKQANFYSLLFLIFAIVIFIANFFQMALFSYLGEQITSQIRLQAYKKMLRMPVQWFDDAKHNPGGLSARLASDCKVVNGLTTMYIGVNLQNIFLIVTSITIAFIYQWRTTLVTLGLTPFMILAGVLQMQQSSGFSQKTTQAYRQSSNLITQVMTNIRTVTSFGYESVVLDKYSQLLTVPEQAGIKKGNVSGVLYGVTQMTMFFVFGFVYFIGTVFIRDVQGVTYENVLIAIYAIVFGTNTVGNNSHYLPDLAAAKQAAANLFEIIDAEDQDQIQIKEGSKLLKSGIKGNFQFKNISFQYATRNTQLFNNLNLSIKQGTKVAFVGHSGCGKSTIFQMILRFYNPSQGQILLDGQNIKDYDVHYLRKQIGVVSQEPVLFNESFRYNIIYNLQNANQQQMIQASRQSNAYDFINGQQQCGTSNQIKNQTDQANNNLKNQRKDLFNRSVGIKGFHISGGQKQRVAIARSILRNPCILLLDEATSALDSVNQKKVQQSLDRIMRERTTISIAHRIDTIKNSDKIEVFDNGKIVQQGTYIELAGKKGYLYNLERGTSFL